MHDGDLISRSALLAEYDRVHVGAPGGARKLIEEAPAVNQSDALSYIKQLEQEREALLLIVRTHTACNYCKHGRVVCGSGADDCEDCTNTACPCRSCTKENDRWEWRGIKDGGAEDA